MFGRCSKVPKPSRVGPTVREMTVKAFAVKCAYVFFVLFVAYWLVMLALGVQFSLHYRADYTPDPEPYGVPRNQDWMKQFEQDYNRLKWGLPFVIPPEATPQNPVGFGLPASHRA